MENMKVIVNKEILDYLNVLNFETQANRILVTYMLSNNMETDTEAFIRYDNAYKENLFKLQEVEKEIVATYIPVETRREKGCAPALCGFRCMDSETGVITL